MTEEIQKRIEAIKAGKVPDGYKKSIVGIVPSEWQEKRLSGLLRFQNGVNAEKEKFNSGIKMIVTIHSQPKPVKWKTKEIVFCLKANQRLSGRYDLSGCLMSYFL